MREPGAGRRMSKEDAERAAKYAAAREKVRSLIVRTLADEFGPDNATRYEDEPNRIGVSLDDGSFVDVQIGFDDLGRITLTPDSNDAPSLLFFDGCTVFRLDINEPFGGTYDRRTRALMQALLQVAQQRLYDMEETDA